jgi:16S rRNA (adenine1518-N6/adenine1519-N6)-dimethyltransferase
MDEKVIFVDENDNQIGTGRREEAWLKGYYTRNVRVVIRDRSGKFLSQKRSLKKGTYPGMWTVAAGGHVDAGETWKKAALREMKEEIGVSAKVRFVGKFTVIDNTDNKKVRQMIRVYESVIDSSTRFDLEINEVDEIKWYELDDLKRLMQKNPNKFTPSFHETINKFY